MSELQALSNGTISFALCITVAINSLRANAFVSANARLRFGGFE